MRRGRFCGEALDKRAPARNSGKADRARTQAPRLSQVDGAGKSEPKRDGVAVSPSGTGSHGSAVDPAGTSADQHSAAARIRNRRSVATGANGWGRLLRHIGIRRSYAWTMHCGCCRKRIAGGAADVQLAGWRAWIGFNIAASRWLVHAVEFAGLSQHGRRALHYIFLRTARWPRPAAELYERRTQCSSSLASRWIV